MTPREQYCAEVLKHAIDLPGRYRNPNRRLAENSGYLGGKMPYLRNGGHRVLEIGPGTGCSLLLMREWGNDVFGSDRDCSDNWARVYSEITRALGLPVEYNGFDNYLRGCPLPPSWPLFDLIYLCRSVDGVIRDYGKYDEAVEALLDTWYTLLAPGGRVFIRHNSGDQQEAVQRVVGCYQGPLKVEMNGTLTCALVKP